jgi:MerR family transcriptional regulator, light-induced transcriptional regulator
MDNPESSPVLRIGELSRRLGVSDHVLRAWESRYGLLQPVRSAGGFRLYSEADAGRVRRMQAHLADGLSAAEAAKAVLGEDSRAWADAAWPPGADTARPSGAEATRPAGADTPWPAGPYHALSTESEESGALRQALDAFDEPAAQAALDRLLSDLSLAAVLRNVVLPYLTDLGERWERGTASIAQEHFASNVIRGRLAGLARGWGTGHGPRAVLACPPGELHELALMVFGIVLNRNGWRIEYLGMSTPVEELAQTVDVRRPDLVVLAAAVPENLDALAPQLMALAQRAPLVLAGAGATPELAAAVGARLLAGDPVTEAQNVRWPR